VRPQLLLLGAPYLDRALVEILLLAVLAGVLGSWIVLRRLAFVRAAQHVGLSLDEVRTALQNEEWRTGWDLSGIPAPIQEQFAKALARAAEVLAGGSAEGAQEELLIARSRFLPGA